MSVQEAAKVLGVKDEAVRKAIREGRLVHNTDVQGGNVRYSVTREAVEEYRNRRSGRVVAGYSKEAIEQNREIFGKFFGDLQKAIEENTALERKAVEQREREFEQREKTNELLEKLIAQNEEAGLALEEISGKKDEGLKEIKEERPWYVRWFGG